MTPIKAVGSSVLSRLEVSIAPVLLTGHGHRIRGARLALALPLAVLLSACADMSGIASHAMLMESPLASAVTAPALADKRIEIAPVDIQWWRAFGDLQLNGLVDRALSGSPTIKLAQARIAKAQAATVLARAAELPQVNGALDLTRQKLSENYIYPKGLGGSIQEFGLLQLTAGWELDFFGKNKSALESALGTANAAVAEGEAARIALAGNVTTAYVRWAQLVAQRDVARRTLAQREENLKLVGDRVSAGLDTRLEQRQSEGALPAARQQIEALDEQIAITRHAIDALVGAPNATEELTSPKLFDLQAIAIEGALPADLLGRRADVAAARWRVEAASQDVANAKTQFYPNVSLTAFVGLQSLGFDKLLTSSSQQWGVGPAIRLPIFEAGKLRANLRGKNADLDAAIESYNSTVLGAVRDAADQLTSVQSIVRQQVQLGDALGATEEAYQISVQRYQAGLGNYLNVLSAETAVLAQRRLRVDLDARALDARIGLARALGGGWQPNADTVALEQQAQAQH